MEVPGIGKKMLSLTVNAAAEKIIREELNRFGAADEFIIAPAEAGDRSVMKGRDSVPSMELLK